ncbi:MAG: 50S ribosome-binding GTPase [Selenomonadaceae bacterium]|nr:50S ribosome-binding GTPase [Selenomonadaceae bacterium]
MEEFQLTKFTNEGSQLLREVTDEFNRLGIDSSNLPKTFPDDDGKIKLVFVGQYSAGKSSLIKMLTGEDVAIGAAITTQNSTPYDWNGLEIVDTPGIETELRPDHDEITYEQINHAALLIFVITNEGFSQRMGDHFRKLAIDQKRAANMVLVVNKMCQPALGNVPEQQEIIYEDLKKVTEPYDPKDLYLSFTDAESYLKADSEPNERRKQRAIERSGREIFIDNLNRFVADKGVLQIINLPLNTIAAEIRKASAEPSAEMKSDAQALIETFRHGKKILVDGQRECFDEIIGLISEFKDDVSKRGRDTAESVFAQTDEDSAKKVLSAAQERVQRSAEDCAQKISDRIKTFAESTETKLQTYEQSTFVKQVKTNFVTHLQSSGSNDLIQGGVAALGAGGVVAGAFVAQQGAQFAAQFAKVGITPLGNAVGNAVGAGVGFGLAGTDAGIFSGILGKGAGELVKNLPIFKAEPTMVNKIAQMFTGNGSKILGAGLAVAGAAVSIWMLYRENQQAEKRERELQRRRNEIMTGFNDLADDIGRDILNGVKNFMTQNIDPLVKNFDAQIKAVEDQISGDKAKSKKLAELLTRTENLIAEIQA